MPQSFQLDHLWQIANGGPAYDPANAASSHRGCNRLRSDTIDDIAIAVAASYGVTLTKKAQAISDQCAPAGQHCGRCNGTHGPGPGRTFVTSLQW